MAVQGHKLTLLSLKIGRIFLIDARKPCPEDRRHWNYEVACKVGSEPMITHGVLQDFEERGWLMSAREDRDPKMGRTPRKFYELTPVGMEVIGSAIMALQLAST
jgi:hypothetical protein